MNDGTGNVKPDQWFTLWIAILSVLGGCIAALVSVWAGASLALRSNRRSLRHERALTAAERCLAAVDQAAEEYRLMSLAMSPNSEGVDASVHKDIIDKIVVAYDDFVESEVGHEAWLLENRAITFAVAECLHHSMQLHLDSFLIEATELKAAIDRLFLELQNAGDMLRATILDKRVSELTDKDRYIIYALLPGRHSKQRS